MPKEIQVRVLEEEETRDRLVDPDDENYFSQDDDDKAGRSWHGMNSEVSSDEVGRFEEDIDEELEELPRPGKIDRV